MSLVNNLIKFIYYIYLIIFYNVIINLQDTKQMQIVYGKLYRSNKEYRNIGVQNLFCDFCLIFELSWVVKMFLMNKVNFSTIQ